jgi:hypothetical protein
MSPFVRPLKFRPSVTVSPFLLLACERSHRYPTISWDYSHY